MCYRLVTAQCRKTIPESATNQTTLPQTLLLFLAQPLLKSEIIVFILISEAYKNTILWSRNKMSDETKVIYHIDDEDTPYLVKLPVGPDKVTLADFKNVLNRPNYKFFFKSMDDDFGVVKEEIIEDECPLPCFNGRVVSWLVSAEGGSVLSDETGSQCGTDTLSSLPPGAERGPGVGETRPPSFHGGPISSRLDSVDTADSIAREFDDTESSITSVSQIGRRRHGGGGRMPLHGRTQQLRGPGGSNRFGDASSVLSSEIETTSFFDTEDNESMASSRY